MEHLSELFNIESLKERKEPNSERASIVKQFVDIINQERKPAKKKSNDNSIAFSNVRKKRDRMEETRLYLADSTSDLMEFGKTL